jgi:hypothetical protein
MSLYPNILDISSYNAMLAQAHQAHEREHKPQHQDNNQHQDQHQHQHHALFDSHHVSEALVDFLSHMFAPTSYMQCTSSTPCWLPPRIDADSKQRFIVDDDIVMVEEEEAVVDGGPLHRETTIASWKAKPEKQERRRSIQWLASVIRRDSVHA